jgi:hypothetical protein
MQRVRRWCSDLFWRCLLACAAGRRRERMEWMGRTKCVSYFFMQRILRLNSHVPWPVHWTSDICFPGKIVCRSWRSQPGFMPGQYIQAINGIEIGENVRIGPGAKLISANHDPDDFERHLPAEPIRIGDNCWIGAGAIVLPGVRLGNHVVVAAGAVVTRDVPADSLAAGVPARVVKSLTPRADA